MRHVRAYFKVASTLIVLTCLAFAIQPGTAASGPAPARQDASAQSYFPLAVFGKAVFLHGLNFSPYMDGQNPDWGSVVSEAQLRSRMVVTAPHTGWMRTFGMDHGLERSGRVAHEMGLKAALGAWIGSSHSSNQAQIAALIKAARAGEADMVIVGSEALYRGDVSEARLLEYIAQVQAAVPEDVPVAVADVFDVLLAHPAVMAAADVVAINMYPYWNGIPVEDGPAVLDDWYARVQAAAGDKPVIVSETGWPSCGDTRLLAVPSPENAGSYFRNVTAWARARKIDLFYFEAFDESWKALKEGPQGACWGVWDKTGGLKPWMAAPLGGQSAADTWSGDPAVKLLHVPALNSFDDLQGYVLHADPATHRMLVYIRVGGGWWIKPTTATPLSAIRANSLWTVDITTGGSDQTATEIAVYLVPAAFDPPLLVGAADLPAGLAAYPQVHATRSP